MVMSDDPPTERDVDPAGRAAPDTLDGVWEDAWSRLEAAVRQRLHPYRTCVVATAGDDGVDARTVVLRGADRATGTLRFHTDRRSAKLAHLLHDRRVALVFYGDGVQVRARGIATVHAEDAAADAAWAATPAMSRRCYLTAAAPGTPSGSPTSGLPPELAMQRPPLALTGRGRDAFAVVAVRVQSIDWLHLAARGQRRAGFSREGGSWMGTWMVP
jgi:3-hydroxyisobutyrate dehydrogenase